MFRTLFPFILASLLVAVVHPDHVPVNIEGQSAGAAVAAAGPSATLDQEEGTGTGSERGGWTIMTRKFKPRSTQPTSVMEGFRHLGSGSIVLTAEGQQASTVTELVRRTELILPSPSFECIRPTVERTSDLVSILCIAA